MSDDVSNTPEDEPDLLAAEFVLGLLTGGDLMRARRLHKKDPGFARAVAAWEERLMPFAAEAPSLEPAADIWDRVRAEIVDSGHGAEIIQLRRRVRIWRAATAAAIAASLALTIGLRQTSEEGPPAIVQPRPERAPLMVAALASPQQETLASVVYDPGQSALLVTPGRLEGAAGHDHQLWVIPAGGRPVSLGIVRSTGGLQRVAVAPEVAPHLRARSTLAISVEPSGGSPTGQPTGPVIASGDVVA